MLLQEMKRGFSRRSFLIVFTIGLIICTISAFNVSTYTDMVQGYVFTLYDGFFIFYPVSYSTTFIIIVPLLSCICYSDTYCEDLNSGFIKSIYTRKKKEQYLIIKYIANFIISGIAISVPLIVNYIILILRCPNIKPNAILGPNTILYTQLFSNVFYKHPTLYIALWIGIYFMYSGLFASIGLSLSTLIRKKNIALFLPFILSIVVELIVEIFDKLSYNPVNFLNMNLYQSFTIIIGEFLILSMISFTLFFVGGKRSETF